MVAAAEALLLPRLPPPDDNVRRIRELVARIASDRNVRRVAHLAAASGMTMRSLQRLFARYVGVSPKWVIQRARLHDAAEELARGTARGQATLAADLGYADQAHFIRDFRDVVGVTPAAYAKRIER